MKNTIKQIGRYGRKTVKWTGILLGGFLLVLVCSGLLFRLLSSEPEIPGELVDLGDFRLHAKAVGQRNHKPTVVIEGGAGAPSEYYYWLGELLKDSLRIIRYDRAGIGYSDPSPNPRDPETIAKELHTLLETMGEEPPYLLAGHSYGGHYIKVFAGLYPEEVAGLVFLDSPHPDIDEWIDFPDSPGFVDALYKLGVVAGDLGVLGILDRSFGPLLQAPGIPEEVTSKFTDFTRNGDYIRGYLEEEKGHEKLVNLSREANDFGDLPVRVFSGSALNEEALRKRGMDPEHIHQARIEMQKDMARISSGGKVFFLPGGHITILSDKEQATQICEEILKLADYKATTPLPNSLQSE